jgi:hypothetical protein
MNHCVRTILQGQMIIRPYGNLIQRNLPLGMITQFIGLTDLCGRPD